MTEACCPNCGHEFVLDDDDDYESFTPWRIDKGTDTIWKQIDGEWQDTGETPTDVERFIRQMTPMPMATPFTSMRGNVSKLVMWGFPEDTP